MEPSWLDGRPDDGSSDQDGSFVLQVTCPGVLRGEYGSAVVSCRFSMTAEDPFACEMLIVLDGDEARWVFAFELLQIALCGGSAGAGRVTVRRKGDTSREVDVLLVGETCSATVSVPVLFVERFVAAAELLVGGGLFRPSAARAFDRLLERMVGPDR